MNRLEGVYQFLGFFDALAILFWFVFLFYRVNNYYEKNKNLTHYRFYKTGFYVKFFSAIIFSVIYILVYDGGDSTAYWDSAQKLNNLFWKSPVIFFDEFFHMQPERIRFLAFDLLTGLPPNWIYKEDEAWFAAKLFSLLTFITFKSYFAMTMITAYISFRVSWKLYELVLKHNLFTEKIAAIGILFLPSTCFWCTGITKDMLIYTSVLYLIIQLFTFLNPLLFKKERSWLVLFVSVFIILNVRDFMLLVALGPIFLALGARWSRSKESGFSKWLIQLFFIGIVLVSISGFLTSSKGQEFASEAEVIQKDLKSNTTYGTNRYDLGISDFSANGMIKALPISVFTAFYRPYLWEGDSLFVRISSVEAFCFLILTIRFFLRNNLIQSFRTIRNNELLMTSLVFALILGFFAGYTSGLFGVLVRFKAPLLPFLFLVLMYKKQEQLAITDTKP
ncbi:MAG: hypothetical protein KA210_00565 [Bacteroidia bacterium]|nr:hypothetical protein [Bacteroidia bacterium]